jgi:TolB-like protein/Tfp pilus assembly protein PilF
MPHAPRGWSGLVRSSKQNPRQRKKTVRLSRQRNHKNAKTLPAGGTGCGHKPTIRKAAAYDWGPHPVRQACIGGKTGMSLFEELKRRNVIRVGIAYAVGTWLLAQAADLVLDVMGAPDIILQSLVAILALGFIPVVIFAWAFEITPEGIKKEKDVNRSESITHQTAKKLDIATIALVLGAVALLAVDRMLPEQGRSDGQDALMQQGDSPSGNTNPGQDPRLQKENGTDAISIAVLPFVDMSPAKDNEYFTDGLTEELLNILAQIKSLQVAGRTSSFAFKGKTEDLREIGEKLNVSTLLEGSVRKDDQRQRIRVTVQLINVADGYHIWSDTYDRDLEDVFAIQEDIARQVADALKINLLGEEAAEIVEHARTGMNAYDLYLKGLQALNLYTFDSLREAEQLFQQSLQIDPDYLPTQLALVRTWLELSGTGALAPRDAFAKSDPVITEILSTDPNNSVAYTYRASILDFNEDYAGAEVAFTRALELNPRNAYALMEFGRFLFDRGKVDEGLELLNQAAQIEPYDIKVQWELCMTQAVLTNVENAQKFCNRIGEIQPGNPMQYYGMAYLYLFRGEFAQFVVWQEKAMEVDPDDPELPAGQALVWMDLGDFDEAEKWLQRAARIDPEHAFVVAARIRSLQYQEQHQQAAELANRALEKELPDRQGSADVISGVVVNDAIARGDYDRALAVLKGRLPEGLESPLEAQDDGDAFTLASMAMVIQMRDPGSDQPAALLQRADELNSQSFSRAIPFEQDFNRALIESARGNTQQAISALTTAFERGWRWDWQLFMRNDFRFESLHDEPEFKDLLARFEADMEGQRQEAYELLELKP